MGENVSRRAVPCIGCSRPIGPQRPWCASCDTRLPAELRNGLLRAQQQMADAVERGRRWLRMHPSASERDVEILTLVAQGAGDADAAQRLGISTETVKDHLRRMSRRWGCKGRAHLVATAYQTGLLKIRNRELI